MALTIFTIVQKRTALTSHPAASSKMDSFKIVSWNTAKRLKRIESQIECIQKLKADVVALQEIIPSTEKIFKECLKVFTPIRFQVLNLPRMFLF